MRVEILVHSSKQKESEKEEHRRERWTDGQLIKRREEEIFKVGLKIGNDRHQNRY